MTPWLLILICSCSPLWHAEGVESWGGLSTVPSESECRPYIEKALKELSPESPQEAVDTTGSEHTEHISPPADQEGSTEETDEGTGNELNVVKSEDQSYTSSNDIDKSEESSEGEGANEDNVDDSKTSEETLNAGSAESSETQDNLQDQGTPDEIDSNSYEIDENITTEKDDISNEEQSHESPDEDTTEEKEVEQQDDTESIKEQGLESEENTSSEIKEDEVEEKGAEEIISAEENLAETEDSVEHPEVSEEISAGEEEKTDESVEIPNAEVTESHETNEERDDTQSVEETKESTEETSDTITEDSIIESSTEKTENSKEDAEETKDSVEEEAASTSAEITESTSEETTESTTESAEGIKESTEEISKTDSGTSTEHTPETLTEETTNASVEEITEESKESLEESVPEVKDESTEEKEETEEATSTQANEEITSEDEILPEESSSEAIEGQEQEAIAEESPKEPEPTDEDQLTLEFEIPKVRRPRDHIGEILHLTPESAETEILLAKTIDSTLKELKKLYDNAIRPLEILFKYRDLSNRHFGDPEIFSKPLILFMGPWSGGKSTILNYLLDNEFKSTSLRTGAEPSPAYFNIVMWGEREEVLDGTQLAADWTFSGLQKFGQGLLDRLRGLRLNNPLLEKVNIVEIPGILEIRKQVERLFPFNDACQWFIDRADVIFLVYDPSKLDVGPETEAILDQLKGREYQTRIILNKADQVKPEELMRVQGTLIWNISPLMSSQEPPVMYSTSLWSIPYEQGSPSRLLHAQERAFLRDIRQAIDKRVENKIASARRFAVRVRNHAKMVDCYLTTYYNHKSFFGNRKKVADDIIEHPQNYHIYEGLSTLTNISRYDLPDPEVYRDFFRLNALYDFQRLSDTCTYFRGCPINRLDVSIAYDLPELVGKYKKQAEKVLEAAEKQSSKS